MKYYIDIDGVICNNTYGKYEEATPFYENIKNQVFSIRVTLETVCLHGAYTFKYYQHL